MEPLQTAAMPTLGVVVEINATNSWQAGSHEKPVRLAYVATNSTERLSFCSLQSATDAGKVVQVASRPAKFDDMPYGVVVELHLTADLGDGEVVLLALAQAGATTYYPPQQIDDAR